MEERLVSIDGKHYPLGEFFFVLATQNPIEHEGTFPLPEAQLDRFLIKVEMSYPDDGAEKAMLARLSSPDGLAQLTASKPSEGSSLRTSGGHVSENGASQRIVTGAELQEARALVRRVRYDQSVGDYIHEIVKRTRNHPDLVLGASPRAGLGLVLMAKFSAALDGRGYVIPDDVKRFSATVLSHRLVFQPEVYDRAKGGQQIIADIVDNTPVPRGAAA
jgi:MoxR-like ATPase